MLRGTRASARPGRTSPSRAPRRAPTPRRASFRTSPRVRVFAPLPRSRVLVLLIRSTPPRAHGTSHLRPRVPAAPVAHVRPASRNRSPLIAFAPAPLSLSPTPLYCAVLWNMRNVYGVDHLRKWLIAALSEQPLPQLGEGEAAFKTRALHLLLTCVARSPRPAPRTPVRRFARHAPAHAALVSLALSLSLSLSLSLPALVVSFAPPHPPPPPPMQPAGWTTSGDTRCFSATSQRSAGRRPMSMSSEGINANEPVNAGCRRVRAQLQLLTYDIART